MVYHWCSWKWHLFSMPVWDLLLPGRLYSCLKVMLVFCGMPLVFKEMAFCQYASLGAITVWKAETLFKGNVNALVFMEMAFVQYTSLGPITIWKAVQLFKGNVSVLWYTTGVQGNGISSVCQSGTYYYLEG